jgi:hypothetical protein
VTADQSPPLDTEALQELRWRTERARTSPTAPLPFLTVGQADAVLADFAAIDRERVAQRERAERAEMALRQIASCTPNAPGDVVHVARAALAAAPAAAGARREPTSDGADLIAAERRRQIDAEGYDEAHDDRHQAGELIDAARCYAYAAQVAEWADLGDWFGLDAEGRINLPAPINARWPWSLQDWKPAGDPVRDLTKAGALIAAEVDRLLRKAVRDASA